MQKRTAIIITLLTTIIAVVGLIAWYLLLSPSQGTTGGRIENVFQGFFQNKNPSTNNNGGSIATTTDGSNTQGESQTATGTPQPAPIIRQISSDPVSGFVIITDKKDGPTVRYMQSETGHTWSAPLGFVTKTRLTNTTIPKVYESLWLSDGSRLIARYLDEDGKTIKTFAGSVNPKISDIGTINEGELKGKFLDNNITDLVTGPLPDKLFYILERSSGASGILANADGAKPAMIFSSVIREWLPQWNSNGTLYLTSKASADAPGFLYSLTTGGSQTKILGGIDGLTANVNPKNTMILYSSSNTRRMFDLYVYDIKTKTSSQLPIGTLAEKCVWNELNADIIYCGVPTNIVAGKYPDDWYKGLATFDDDLWKINTKTGEASVVAQFKEVTQTPIDIIKPKVSANGAYVVFVNKYDLSLWSVRVK